jgi:hypothetical protein
VWDIFFIFFPSSFHPNSPPEEHPEAEESGMDSRSAVFGSARSCVRHAARCALTYCAGGWGRRQSSLGRSCSAPNFLHGRASSSARIQCSSMPTRQKQRREF